MKINRTSVLFSMVFCLFLSFVSYSQVITRTYFEGIKDLSILNKINNSKEYTIDPPGNFGELKKQALKNINVDSDFRYRYAIGKSINYDFIKNSSQTTNGNTITCSVKLKVEDAYNLSLQFSSFFLSPHSVLSIYSQDEVTGTITAEENNLNNTWASKIYNGNYIVLQLVVPKEELVLTKVVVSEIFLGYKPVGYNYSIGHPGVSQSCNVNIVCPNTYGSGTLRNAVALISDGNGSLSTGTLVMNTCGTNAPYVLTADHVYTAQTNVSKWVFVFQYLSTSCSTNTGYSESAQYNGGTMQSHWSVTDFALILLSKVPPANSGLYYAGWSRNTPPPPNGSTLLSTFCLSHPGGDVMKYASDNDYPGLTSFHGGTNNLWVANFDYGTIQPGSSGSALCDYNGRIIGQLSGSQVPTSDYCAVRRGEYGRFDQSWIGGGTAGTGLVAFLDPQSTNAPTTNTTAGSSLANVDFVISGPTTICGNSATYSVNTTLPIDWVIAPSNIVTPTTGSGSSITVNKVGSGSITVKATVSSGCLLAQYKIISVNVGAPVVSASGTQTSYCHSGYQQWNLSATPSSGGTNWNWQVAYLGQNASISISNPSSPSPIADVKGGGTLKLTYTNLCGVSVNAGGPTVYSNCPASFTVSPNPAKSYIIIRSDPASEERFAALFYAIRITDHLGTIRKTLEFKSGQSFNQLSVADLKSGVYKISLFDGIQWVTQSLIIQ